MKGDYRAKGLRKPPKFLVKENEPCQNLNNPIGWVTHISVDAAMTPRTAQVETKWTTTF